MRCALWRTIGLLVFPALTLNVMAAPPRVPLVIKSYVINADLDPAANKLTATAVVTFTALEDLSTASFELNNGLADYEADGCGAEAADERAAFDQLDSAGNAADADGEEYDDGVDV